MCVCVCLMLASLSSSLFPNATKKKNNDFENFISHVNRIRFLTVFYIVHLGYLISLSSLNYNHMTIIINMIIIQTMNHHWHRLSINAWVIHWIHYFFLSYNFIFAICTIKWQWKIYLLFFLCVNTDFNRFIFLFDFNIKVR